MGGQGSGRLILLRHGESTGNSAGVFTGLLDVPLTSRGVAEAIEAGRLLAAEAVPAAIHTSVLTRAVATATIIAEALGLPAQSVQPDARINERHYGALTGRTRGEVLAEAGREQFLRWRRSVNVAPPPISDGQLVQLAEHGFRVVDVALRTESLQEVIRRVAAFHREVVVPQIAGGITALVVGHGNSLRAYCAVIDDLGDAEV